MPLQPSLNLLHPALLPTFLTLWSRISRLPPSLTNSSSGLMAIRRWELSSKCRTRAGDGQATTDIVDRYVNRAVAEKYDMYTIYEDHVTWNVDTRTVLYPGGPNRKSIRLLSQNNYTQGLVRPNKSIFENEILLILIYSSFSMPDTCRFLAARGPLFGLLVSIGR